MAGDHEDWHLYSSDVTDLNSIEEAVTAKEPVINLITKQHDIPYTALQMLVWHYMGLDIMQVSRHQLKQNELIRQATLAFDHFWLQQHCDRFRHPWTPNEVMLRLEELLGTYAPGVLSLIHI